MSDLFRLIWCALIGIFRPRAALQAEILVLRHQLIVLRRKSPKRLAFGNVDRLVFTALYHVAPGVLDALKILTPQTVIRWHRAGLMARFSPRGISPPSLLGESVQSLNRIHLFRSLRGPSQLRIPIEGFRLLPSRSF